MALDFRTRPQITLTKMIKIQSFKEIKINLINYLFRYLHVHLFIILYKNIMQLILFYVKKQDEIIFNRPDLFGT